MNSSVSSHDVRVCFGLAIFERHFSWHALVLNGARRIIKRPECGAIEKIIASNNCVEGEREKGRKSPSCWLPPEIALTYAVYIQADPRADWLNHSQSRLLSSLRGRPFPSSDLGYFAVCLNHAIDLVHNVISKHPFPLNIPLELRTIQGALQQLRR